MKLSCYILLLLLLATSCRIDRPPLDVNTPIIVNGDGVYVCNEGNFQYGNASLSYYNHGSNEVIEKYYEQINQMSLGDVCQSMSFTNGATYIVMNNSGKIIVVDPYTFEWKADILGFTSPRYVLPISNRKAYVSELFDKRLRVINLSENTISKSILLGGESEEMKVVYGKAFITSPNRGLVYVVDTERDVLQDSIILSKGASSIQEDQDGLLWVLCSGDDAIKAALYTIDPTSLQVVSQFDFEAKETPTKLKINSSNDTVYYINESIYKMGIHENALPEQAFIESNGRVLYSIGINPNNKDLYVADAIDYIQRGSVYIYQQSGTEINTFKAGIIPGNFYFQ